MSDKSEQSAGGYEPSDPWAPPEHRTSLDKSASPQQPPQPPQPQSPQPPAGSVHDQPTVIGMPAASGSVPPPPTAPGGPAQGATGPYGYPGVPPQSTPGAQQSASPFGAPTGAGTGPGYGYPGYTAPAPAASGYPGYGQTGWQQSPANGMGVAALVLGIIAMVTFCFWGLGVILGVLALIFGIVGRRRATRGEATNGGMALAGIILGAIGAVLSAAFLAFLVFAIAYGESGNATYDDPFATSFSVSAGR
ncbi:MULTISPECIES: DUF4190 domain-containing protein [unclassified Streptomyces]|uniref:DUF4190 domain-containing protein n=1 Tax=unclassified Streptomyces TaxID=2593676 RepID=UPI00382A9E6E